MNREFWKNATDKELDLREISLAREKKKKKEIGEDQERWIFLTVFKTFLLPSLLVEHENWANGSQSLQLDSGLQKQASLVSCFPGGTLKVSKIL